MGATSQHKELFEDYDGFVEKFKPKKTTDDCYTPPEIYEVIKQWACREYGIDASKIVRPFYPGGDFEHYDYPDGCCVLDNPPFSILSKIVAFYIERNIDFFLFAPTLTLLSARGGGIGRICANSNITYENGASVNTSFISNLEPAVVRSAPDLFKIIKQVDDKLRAQLKKQTPAYEYPSEIITAARVGSYSKYGIDYRVMPGECVHISALDQQRAHGKAIYGRGLLLSEQATLARIETERELEQERIAHQQQPQRWALSERERAIQQNIGRSYHA